MSADWRPWINSRGQLWVNVASSYLALDEFVNFDRSIWLTLAPAHALLRHVLSAGHENALRAMAEARRRTNLISRDCRKPLPVPDGVVDHILCSHFLEHLPAPVAEGVLADFFRALRPGGSVHIVLPDLRYHVDRYMSGEIDADGLVSATALRSRHGDGGIVRVMEAVGGFGLLHQWMYDPKTAVARIEAAGFEIANRETPSSSFRRDDPESLHVVGLKR